MFNIVTESELSESESDAEFRGGSKTIFQNQKMKPWMLDILHSIDQEIKKSRKICTAKYGEACRCLPDMLKKIPAKLNPKLNPQNRQPFFGREESDMPLFVFMPELFQQEQMRSHLYCDNQDCRGILKYEGWNPYPREVASITGNYLVAFKNYACTKCPKIYKAYNLGQVPQDVLQKYPFIIKGKSQIDRKSLKLFQTLFSSGVSISVLNDTFKEMQSYLFFAGMKSYLT